MREKVLFLCLWLSSMLCAQGNDSLAAGRVYQGFSGGMMVHTGYLFGRDRHAPVTYHKFILMSQSCDKSDCRYDCYSQYN